MSRQVRAAPDALRRVRRDARFRAALDHRFPNQNWRSRGECLQHDPELFFPNNAEDPAPAIAICRLCSVLGPCLATALDAGDCDGVWGGTTPDERRVMRDAWPAGVDRARV